MCTQLSIWKWLQPQLPYRGRVQDANNMVTSCLTHCSDTTKRPGRGHSESHLGLLLVWPAQGLGSRPPTARGRRGQGLINIHSKIASFRLQTLQRLLYNYGPRYFDTDRPLLRRAGQLGYKKIAFPLITRDCGPYWTNTFL